MLLKKTVTWTPALTVIVLMLKAMFWAVRLTVAGPLAAEGLGLAEGEAAGDGEGVGEAEGEGEADGDRDGEGEAVTDGDAVIDGEAAGVGVAVAVAVAVAAALGEEAGIVADPVIVGALDGIEVVGVTGVIEAEGVGLDEEQADRPTTSNAIITRDRIINFGVNFILLFIIAPCAFLISPFVFK
jgi:hypothetical protein